MKASSNMPCRARWPVEMKRLGCLKGFPTDLILGLRAWSDASPRRVSGNSFMDRLALT